MEMNSLLTFENVHCWKGNGAGRKEIIRDLSFSLEPGGIVTLLGPSGSGKSTVLRLAVGLDEIASGRIWFHGRAVSEWDIRELRRRVGMVFQLPYLFPGTVKDNLLYAPRIHQRLPENETTFVRDLLDQVGLPSDLLSRSSTELSVGQQMRVSLARTLANHPEILLLDEPASALDPKAAAMRNALIPSLNSMMRMGIVQLPGIMSGQIIGGIVPEQAVRYQIIVVYMLAGAVALVCHLTVKVEARSLFTKQWALVFPVK